MPTSETKPPAPNTDDTLRGRVQRLEGDLDTAQQTIQGLRHGASAAEEALRSTQAQLLLYASDLQQSYTNERASANELDQAALDLVLGLVQTVEARDPYTADHGWRVSRYALGMAQVLGWSAQQQELVEVGGRLHDLGKIGIDDYILRKPGLLTAEEYQTMQTHVTIGLHILENIQRLSPILPYLAYHHERHDGQGYPFGLAGMAIPIEGRLLAVADTFDAVTSARPYRPARPAAEGLRELDRHEGTQFDPEMVEAFHAANAAGLLPLPTTPRPESSRWTPSGGVLWTARPPALSLRPLYSVTRQHGERRGRADRPPAVFDHTSA